MWWKIWNQIGVIYAKITVTTLIKNVCNVIRCIILVAKNKINGKKWLYFTKTKITSKRASAILNYKAFAIIAQILLNIQDSLKNFFKNRQK